MRVGIASTNDVTCRLVILLTTHRPSHLRDGIYLRTRGSIPPSGNGLMPRSWGIWRSPPRTEVLADDDVPLAQSLLYQRPPLVQPMPPPEGQESGIACAMLDLEGDRGLDVFAATPGGNWIDLWCAEITGSGRELGLKLPPGWQEAELSGLGGDGRHRLPVIGGHAILPLHGSDLFCLRLLRTSS